MAVQPHVPGPDTGSYQVIHLGGQAAVVVPVADFLRLRALEQAAAPHEIEDAEDTAAMLEWKPRDAAGQTTLVSADESAATLRMSWRNSRHALLWLPECTYWRGRPFKGQAKQASWGTG